jgi:hypothetical protein
VLCFCFVFLRLVYPMLPVSLNCPYVITPSIFSSVYFCPVSCVPYVAIFSGLSIMDCPLRYSLTFIFVLCLVYPMLPVSLDCPHLITPSVFSNVYFQPHLLVELMLIDHLASV